MDWNKLLITALGNTPVTLVLLAVIAYLVKQVAELQLQLTEMRKERDAEQREFWKTNAELAIRVTTAVERLDLPGPK